MQKSKLIGKCSITITITTNNNNNNNNAVVIVMVVMVAVFHFFIHFYHYCSIYSYPKFLLFHRENPSSTSSEIIALARKTDSKANAEDLLNKAYCKQSLQ